MDEDQIEAWHTLVHVCQECRNIVFGSPRRLDLRLLCTHRTPVREMLDIWPLLPIVVQADNSKMWNVVDNIVAALEHNDRICQLQLPDIERAHWQLDFFLEAMQRPFPALRHLQLWLQPSRPWAGPMQAAPDSFLGGSAPHLQTLSLCRILFQDYRNFFYLPLTFRLFVLTFGIYLIPDTFLQTQCSLASPWSPC